ncbi:MAG: MarR family winged helix-turn-helix transcriptional regulator [Terriglobales bacterium]
MNKKRPARRAAGAAEEAVFVELWRTLDRLGRGVAELLKPEQLTPTQYNVLRILRGAPQGLACGEVAGRMVTRDPDITRLLDRMEKSGLIQRERLASDRRTVITRITAAGKNLLNRLDEPVRELHRRQLGHLGEERLQRLRDLLRLAGQVSAE